MNQAHPKRSTKMYYEAECIGNLAYESLSKNQDGSVFGLTSRGAFIKTDSKWLNFLSFESFRGPLTINLPISEGASPPVSRGMNLQIAAGEITFPDAGLVVSIQDPVIWQPKPPSLPSLPVSERRTQIISSAERILAIKKEIGLAGLLPKLQIFPSGLHQDQEYPFPLQAEIQELQSKTMSSSRVPAAEPLINLLGSGSGLTPSGDDLVCGVLLALNRWKNVIINGHDLDRLNQEVVEAAYLKTTTISANLIECATLGLADERLIEALDWLMSGREKETPLINKMLDWGSSSGIDVFIGFVVALSV